MPRIVDLTHFLTNGLGVFPGDPEVSFAAHHHYQNGYFVSRLTMGTHTGTHVDAPIHKFPGAKSLTDMGLAPYIGFQTALLDFRGHDGEIHGCDLRKALAPFPGCDAVLIRSGWVDKWGTPAFFEGFPSLNEDVADALAALNVHLIGLETPSVNASRHASVHESLLGKEIAIVESLCGFDALPTDTLFAFHAAPLKLKDLDGSPVRAYALLP